MTDKPRSVLGILLLTVLIDMVGFSVIFPLFPQILEYYLNLEGAESIVGRLVATLVRIGGSEFAVVALFGGVLGSVYSLLQFLFAPVWGGLSDRIGRRPTLLITLAGTALAQLLWFFSGSFLVLLVARTVGGIMAGNIATASAVVADTYAGRERAKGMGMLGACIGLGFIIGPVIGAITGHWNLLDFWPGGAAFGVNPFSVCALAAFGLALVNLAWAAARLHETYPLERRRQARTDAAERTIHPLAALRGLDYPGVRRTNLAYLLFTIAFAALEFTIVFLAVDRLGYRPTDNMWLFIFMGLILIAVQGGIVRRIVPRMGERSVATWGVGLTLPGFVLIGLAQSGPALYAGLALVSIGSGLVLPCLSALVSRYTPENRQGLALGVFRSNGALARAIGPFLGGLLYWQLGSWAPYYLGACLLLLPLAMTFTLPPVPEHQ
jgi:MFS family permease